LVREFNGEWWREIGSGGLDASTGSATPNRHGRAVVAAMTVWGDVPIFERTKAVFGRSSISSNSNITHSIS
jgi:hypothetical protein